jgi:DNA invertase Pin-like site-specific DNA recombinase
VQRGGSERRAGIYVRISKDRTGDEAGIARQEDECRALAGRLGWSVVGIYADNDREASSGKPRPAYLRMLDDMRNGSIDAVVGWHSDRIYRRPDELEELIKIADANDIQFAAVQVGNIDLSTASGRLVARLLGATAKYETELKGERQSAQLRQLALAGRTTGGGTRMFGYADQARTSLVDDEAAALREVADRALAGESVTACTAWLNQSGMSTVLGGRWQPAVVKRMLVNPAIAGIATFKGEVVGKAQWPAIIDEATHGDLVARLSTSAKHRPGPRIAYLQGLVWCGACDYELVTAQVRRQKTDPQVRAYGCKTRWLMGRPGYQKACGGITIKAEWLEDDVAEQMLARLATPQARTLMAAVGSPTIKSSISVKETIEIEQKLTQLGVDFADDLIGRTEFIAARERLGQRLAKIKTTVAQAALPLPYGDPKELVAWWEGATVSQRQALAKQQIERVVIGNHRGRRDLYDPSRVQVVWR